MLTPLGVLPVLSALTYTPIGDNPAAVAAATIVGLPITCLVLSIH
ncbi:hypothetical protein [Marivita sp. S6314]|nr:hypothetical protein [Marivita sp. S6314]